MSATHSIGAMNQLADAMDEAGYAPKLVTRLRSTPGLLAEVKLVLLGLASIVRACFKLALDKAFDPSFVGQGWTIWKGPADGKGWEGDEDCVSEPKVADFEQIVTETHLQEEEGETSIPGEEKMRRARDGKNQQLGGRSFRALWENWVACRDAGKPEDSILEKLYRAGKIGSIIYFFGMTLRTPGGHRYVLCLYRGSGGRWPWGCHWLGRRWPVNNPSAALASVGPQNSDPKVS